MYPQELIDKVMAKFPEATAVATPEKFIREPKPQVNVPAAKLHDVCAFLKSDKDFAMDMPNHMTAVDYIKENS